MSVFLTRLSFCLGVLSRLVAHRSPAGLHPVAETLRILERERVRADRTGDRFSLIAFLVRNPHTDEGTLAFLAKALRRRLRVTDEAGWLSHACIGAILPHTPAQGAWTLADDVCLSFPAEISLPACKVYHYPSDDAARGIVDRQEATRTQVTTATNRPYEESHLALLLEEPALASVQAKTGALRQQLAGVRGELKTRNDSELRIARLPRDVELQRTAYAKYSTNLEQARIDPALEE